MNPKTAQFLRLKASHVRARLIISHRAARDLEGQLDLTVMVKQRGIIPVPGFWRLNRQCSIFFESTKSMKEEGK